MEDWALIRRLAAEGVPKKQIAERLAISRTTVGKAVASFAPFDTRGRALLAEHPEMPALAVVCDVLVTAATTRNGVSARKCPSRKNCSAFT